MSIARIDTHMHCVPPAYRAYLKTNGVDGVSGGALPPWSVDSALAFMDDCSIATGILSVSAPGVWFGDRAGARSAARAINEFTAECMKDRPDRFGFFATLTLPDVDGAIAEAVYALDVLRADGVIVLANSAGIYLGDPRFDALMAELERRSAAVFIHPTELPGPAADGISPFAADFLLDTTRAAIGLAKSGTLLRYPNVKFILAHAGGFVPYAAHRMAPICSQDGSLEAGLTNLGRFYFDVALSASPTALPSLLAFAQPDRVTYGSDWPWAPRPVVDQFIDELERYPLDQWTRNSVERGAAAKLFPRLAAAANSAPV